MPANRSLSVWLDSYRRDLKSAIAAAAVQGFAGVQPNVAGTPELSAEQLSESAKRHLARHLRDRGLAFDGLAAAFPGRGLAEPRDADARVAELRRTLELARQMQVRHAIVTLGGFAEEKSAAHAEEMVRVAAELADRTQVQLALLPTDGAVSKLASAIRRSDCPSLRLAADTLALAGSDAADWADLASCVHLRDGRPAGASVEEVAFGAGSVDFRALLARFAQADRPSPSLVVRQDRPGSVDGLRDGREYIRSIFPAGGR